MNERLSDVSYFWINLRNNLSKIFFVFCKIDTTWISTINFKIPCWPKIFRSFFSLRLVLGMLSFWKIFHDWIFCLFEETYDFDGKQILLLLSVILYYLIFFFIKANSNVQSESPRLVSGNYSNKNVIFAN